MHPGYWKCPGIRPLCIAKPSIRPLELVKKLSGPHFRKTESGITLVLIHDSGMNW